MVVSAPNRWQTTRICKQLQDKSKPKWQWCSNSQARPPLYLRSNCLNNRQMPRVALLSSALMRKWYQQSSKSAKDTKVSTNNKRPCKLTSPPLLSWSRTSPCQRTPLSSCCSPCSDVSTWSLCRCNNSWLGRTNCWCRRVNKACPSMTSKSRASGLNFFHRRPSSTKWWVNSDRPSLKTKRSRSSSFSAQSSLGFTRGTSLLPTMLSSSWTKFEADLQQILQSVPRHSLSSQTGSLR